MAIAQLQGLSFRYPAGGLALRDVWLELDAGVTMVAGPSGGGKSTLLRALNGLVPHFHGGRISGRAVVAGLDVLSRPAREAARHVGFVFQDPEQQSVYGTVEREVAFGLENVACPPSEMPRLVERALASVGALELRGRRLATLSGGERQRVALASVLALEPSVVVLDEPTSQLDAGGAALVTAACAALAAGGRCVVVAEHRLEDLLPAAGLAVLVDEGSVVSGPPGKLAGRLPSPPAVVRLSQLLGWRPVVLSVDAARVLAPPVRPSEPRPVGGGEVAWALAGVSAGLGGQPVLAGVDLEGRAGEVVVLMGPNGGGKTTLLRVIAGLTRPLAGRADRLPGRIAYLPQNPVALLHRPTVLDEVRLTLGRAGEPDEALAMLEEVGLAPAARRYPRDLSSGERQRAALAAILAGSPRIALLDEPTRGMDLRARRALQRALGRLRERGCSTVVATHDSELAAEVGDRVVAVEGGGARHLGPPARALSGDSPYATQVGRLYPGGPVTPEEVAAAL